MAAGLAPLARNFTSCFLLIATVLMAMPMSVTAPAPCLIVVQGRTRNFDSKTFDRSLFDFIIWVFFNEAAQQLLYGVAEQSRAAQSRACPCAGRAAQSSKKQGTADFQRLSRSLRRRHAVLPSQRNGRGNDELIINYPQSATVISSNSSSSTQHRNLPYVIIISSSVEV